MTPTEPTPLPAAPQQETGPFWGYPDVFAFLGLAVPSLLVGVVATRLLFYLLHWQPRRKAFELLPAQFIAYCLLFFALYGLLKFRYRKPFWTSLAWFQPGVSRWSLALAGMLLALAISLLGVLLKVPDVDTPIKELLKDRTSILLLAIFAVSLGPIFEELTFRGFFQPLLVRSLGLPAGIVLTALFFGLLHLEQYAGSWRHVLLITSAGCAFGWVRHRHGTRASAWMHAGYNAAFFIGLITQTKSLPTTW